MSNILKRFLSLMIVLVMVISMVPAQVFATEAEVNNVAEVNGTEYATVAEAIATANAGDTVTLLASIDKLPVIDKAITIDGNGASVAGTAGENQFGSVNGTVTIQNVTFTNGNEAIRTDYLSADYSNLDLVIKGCRFESLTTYAIMGGKTDPDNHLLKSLTVEGCEFNASNVANSNYMVYAQCVGKLNITGCTFTGNGVTKGAVHTGDSSAKATVATISGNTITGVARGVQIGNRVAGSSVAVSSNTFSGVTTAADSKSGAIYVHGNADPDASVSITNNDASSDCTNFLYNDNNTTDGDHITQIVTTFTGNKFGGKEVIMDADGNVIEKPEDSGDTTGATEIDLSQGSYTIETAGEYVVKGGITTTNTLTVKAEGDVTITLNGVTINALADTSAISIEKGNVTLISTGDTNNLYGGDNGAGIYVAADASLTIQGDEMLNAAGNDGVDDASGAAGIGGTYANGASGKITIDGATVTALGYGVWASGIGSAGGYAEDITIINGADVYAVGGYYADGAGTLLQTSYGKNDPEGGAAIGGGSKDGAGVGTITITDSVVEVYGGSKAAGIGAMFWNSVEAITIGGNSNVTAQGGSSSAGIGTSRAGDTGVSATITITGGTVTATGGAYGAGIGAGYNADSLGNKADASALPETTITISGGNVTATGGEGGAGIGGGYKSDNINADITGGTVTAAAGALVSGKTVASGGAPAAIGSGANGSGVFENSPAAEIGANATVTVTAYYEGKAAIEGMTNEAADALENVTVIESGKPAYVVYIGKDGYLTLDAALDAAKAANMTEVEITVKEDITLSTKIKDFTKVTFTGTDRAQTIDMNLGASIDVNTELVFNDLTVSRLDSTWLYHYTYIRGGLTYNDCKMVGLFNVTVQDTDFIGCDFYNDDTFGNGSYSLWLYNCAEGVEVNITDCTFDVYERAIKMYGDGYSGTMTLNISGTEFTSRTADKTVVEMAYDQSTGVGAMNLNITNSTATGFGAPEHIEGEANAWFNVEGSDTNSTVFIDGVQVWPVIVYVAQIGDVKYTTFETAIAAAVADASITRIDILCDVQETVATAGETYWLAEGQKLVIGATEPVTITLDRTAGETLSIYQNAGSSLTIEENVTIEGLDIIANGFATTGENTTIAGDVKLLSLKQWTSDGEILVTETGSVCMGYGDGQLDLAYGNGTLTINGNGDKTAAQFKAGYSGTRGNGNTLNLNDTYFEAGAWFNLNGSNGTINADNALLKVSGGDASGKLTMASSGNVINLTNGSELVVATLTIGSGNTVKLSAGNKITATTISGAGKIVIDATGMTEGEVTAITGDASGFTGEIEVVNNNLYAEIVEGKIILKAKPVAKVGTTEYTTIDEAVAAWTNGTTLTLLADVTLSDVFTFPSTESRTLDLGTYTMTAAEGKHAIEITCNGQSSATYGLTVKADAEKPGGITATGKSCIYYRKSGTTKDRVIIRVDGGVFNGSYAINVYSSNRGTNCPQVSINGGTFNGNVNVGHGKLIVTGGTFNGWVNCTGDSTAYRLISGGKFKSWQFMTADAANKFGVGSALSTYDKGVYVDDEGYLVVGGSVITEPGTTYEASTAYSTWSSYLKYSSAAENGLYWTSAEAAIAKKTTGTVNVYVDELDMTGSSFKGTIVSDNITITFAEGTTPAWTVAAATEGMTATYTETVADGVVTRVYKAIYAVAQIGETYYESLAEALTAAQDGDTVELLWAEGKDPIAMNGALYGKSVTITGTATVDWSKGFLFVGRGGEGNGTVIFDNANLTSASNSASYGIHVSGREKNTTNKYDGTLEIKNSTIELDYLINKGAMTLDNSTLTVKNGFSIGGRPASETESGEDATATLNLTNGSKVIVNNHNGMGLGYEAIGVMSIDATSTFETTQSFLVTEKGTMNIAGTATIAGTLTNNGSIVLTDVAATLTSSECGNVTTDVVDHEVAYENGAYVVKELPDVAKIGETGYKSLQAAVDAAAEGDTITLVYDVELTSYVKVAADDKIVLDLNGYVIDGVENCNIAIMSYGDLAVKDSSEEQTGAIKAGKTSGKSGNAVNICGGTFTLESGSIYSVNNALLIDEQAATINIKGGKITAEPTTRNSAVMYISSTSETEINITGGELVGYNGILLWNNTTINMTGGSIDAQGSVGIQGNGSMDNTEINISGDAAVSGYYAAIYHPQDGALNISENATLTGWTGVVVKGGDVNISGGTISGTGAADTYAPVSSGFIDTGDGLYIEHYDNSTNSENYGTPAVTITGGTFTSANASAVASYANPNNNVEALTGFISGGTYTDGDVENYLAEGYELKYSSGKFTVVASAVAVVGGTIYTDLQEAINAANGQIVYLQRNATTAQLTVPENYVVTLELNGKTITGSIVAPNAELTVQNGSIVNKNKSVSALEINAGKLTLTNVNIDSARHALRIDGAVEATINSGTYRGAIGTGTGTYHAVNVSGAANVTIVDGTFVGPKGTTADSGSAVNAQSGATVTIEGGSFSGGKMSTLSASGTLSVKGGTYDQDPTAFLAEGYITQTNEDGTYGVIDDPSTHYISNLEELKAFRDSVNAGNTYKGVTVYVTADIDLGSEEWTPIGNSSNKFQGTFDGQNHTISNLVITGNNSNVGLFGFTTDGEVKNLTINNAKVSGRLNVGVVAGTPYTSKYTNITVTGDVIVEGMAYVGGVGGKNAYADWTDITVNVNEDSYVKATSTENGNAYRTYVGGVIGFMAEGNHTFKNISSNIDVIGDVCDIGGITGIAHYGNNLINVTCSGDVTNTSANAEDVLETGGIAGVWHNGGANVTFENIEYTGTVSTPNADEVELPNDGVIGAAYSTTGTGKIDGSVAIINGKSYATLVEALAAVQEGETIYLLPSTIEEGTVQLPAQLKNVTIKGTTGTVLKDMTIMAADGNSIDYQGVTFDGIVFENSNIVITGWRTGTEIVKDLTVTNCTFQNIVRTSNQAAVHLNMAEESAVQNFTFTNNTIDGLSGASNSGIYGMFTGNVIIENNKINNVAYRPALLMPVTNDGVADYISFSNNVVTGSSVGCLQISADVGTDAVELKVTENIFKDIPASWYYIFAADFAEDTKADFSHNYFEHAPQSNPDMYAYNEYTENVGDLIDMGIYPYYADEAKTTLVYAPAIEVTNADGSVVYYDTMAEAVPYTTNCPRLEGATVKLLSDIEAADIRMMENDMVLDLNGHTYIIVAGTGSQGSNTSGFQIRPEVTTVATIKNGTIEVAEGAPVVWMFNVYAADFVVEDVTVDCANMAYSYGESCYVSVSRSGDNVQFTGTTNIINFNSEVAGSAINVGDTMTIADTVVPGGQIELDGGAALTARAGLDVVAVDDGYVVTYANGVYTAVQAVAQIGDTYYGSLAEAFTAAQDGDEVKILVAGTYALSTSGKDITITGTVEGVEFANIGAKNMGGANVTFNNVTFTYATGSTYKGLQHAGKLVYNNCIINGQVFLYGTSETFNDCTFNTTDANNYNVWTYGAKEVTFDGCTFNCAGKSVLVYNEGGPATALTVTDCKFIASASVAGKAAIEIDTTSPNNAGGMDGTAIVINNSTATGFDAGSVSGDSLWNDKKDQTNLTVTVDGVLVWPKTVVAMIGDVEFTTAAAALAVAKSGDTVVMIADSDETGTALTIYPGVTLDLGTYTLTADSVIGLNGSCVTGATISADGQTGGKLIVPKDNVVLSANAATSGAYAIMPVWLPDAECYVLSLFGIAKYKDATVNESGEMSLEFKHQASSYVYNNYMTESASDSGISVIVRAEWTKDGADQSQEFVYTDAMVAEVSTNATSVYTAEMSGCNSKENFDVKLMIKTDCGVVLVIDA